MITAQQAHDAAYKSRMKIYGDQFQVDIDNAHAQIQYAINNGEFSTHIDAGSSSATLAIMSVLKKSGLECIPIYSKRVGVLEEYMQIEVRW